MKTYLHVKKITRSSRKFVVKGIITLLLLNVLHVLADLTQLFSKLFLQKYAHTHKQTYVTHSHTQPAPTKTLNILSIQLLLQLHRQKEASDSLHLLLITALTTEHRGPGHPAVKPDVHDVLTPRVVLRDALLPLNKANTWYGFYSLCISKVKK